MKFNRTPYGEHNDESEVLAFSDVRRGNNDSLRITATSNDMYFDRIHNGRYVPKYSEDYHSIGLGKGLVLNKRSTGHLKDL